MLGVSTRSDGSRSRAVRRRARRTWSLFADVTEWWKREPSNATVVVDKLESQQLIERRPHPTDRRAKQLTLTTGGAELRERLLKVMTEEPLFAGLTKKERGALQDLLQRAIVAAEPART